jgi:hypothetical protein
VASFAWLYYLLLLYNSWQQLQPLYILLDDDAFDNNI